MNANSLENPDAVYRDCNHRASVPIRKDLRSLSSMTADWKTKSKISHRREVIHCLLQECSPKAPLQPVNNFGSPILTVEIVEKVVFVSGLRLSWVTSLT